MLSFSAKNKGGAGHQVGGGERNVLGRQKFLPVGWPESQNLAGIFTDLLFELKSKKLCNFKDGQFRIFEKHGCPPPLKRSAP